LKCCHTSKTAVTDTYADNYDGNTPAQVFYRDTCRIAAAAYQWFGFQFDTPFSYNGTDNLLFEVWWEGDNDGWAYTYWARSAGRYVCSYIKGTTPYYGYPDKGELHDYLHNMRITISGAAVEATSLGRVKTLFR
jgi:hypothetical protein